MKLRQYRDGDLEAMRALFRGSVLRGCAGLYTPAQLRAWADRASRLDEERFRRAVTLVAEEEGRLLGYGSLEPGGHLDHLYTAAEAQGQGVGTALCDALEAEARRQGEREIHVEASRKARGFLERRGYRVIRAQQVEVEGESLENFCMTLEIADADA